MALALRKDTETYRQPALYSGYSGVLPISPVRVRLAGERWSINELLRKVPAVRPALEQIGRVAYGILAEDVLNYLTDGWNVGFYIRAVERIVYRTTGRRGRLHITLPPRVPWHPEGCDNQLRCTRWYQRAGWIRSCRLKFGASPECAAWFARVKNAKARHRSWLKGHIEYPYYPRRGFEDEVVGAWLKVKVGGADIRRITGKRIRTDYLRAFVAKIEQHFQKVKGRILSRLNANGYFELHPQDIDFRFNYVGKSGVNWGAIGRGQIGISYSQLPPPIDNWDKLTAQQQGEIFARFFSDHPVGRALLDAMGEKLRGTAAYSASQLVPAEESAKYTTEYTKEAVITMYKYVYNDFVFHVNNREQKMWIEYRRGRVEGRIVRERKKRWWKKILKKVAPWIAKLTIAAGATIIGAGAVKAITGKSLALSSGKVVAAKPASIAKAVSAVKSVPVGAISAAKGAVLTAAKAAAPALKLAGTLASTGIQQAQYIAALRSASMGVSPVPAVVPVTAPPVVPAVPEKKKADYTPLIAVGGIIAAAALLSR